MLKDLLENIGKAVAILSFGTLVLTAVRDWGYFSVIGPQFRSIQTTYDYIANVIEWLPEIALGLLSAGLGAAAARMVTKRMYPSTPSGIGRGKRPSRGFVLGMAFVGALPSIMFALFAGGIAGQIGLVSSLILVSGAALFWFATRKEDPTRWMFPVFVAIALLGLFYLTGLKGASTALSRENVYRVQFKGTESKQISLLRTFEKGILVWSPATSKVDFIRWDNVDGLSRVVKIDERSNFCRLLPLFCDWESSP